MTCEDLGQLGPQNTKPQQQDLISTQEDLKQHFPSVNDVAVGYQSENLMMTVIIIVVFLS